MVNYNDDFGIPPLIPQSVELFTPITSAHKWGVKARGSDVNGGMVHFYTDDGKFTGLWRYPQKLLHSGCKHVIEVNYSTYHTFPMAYMLWQLYQKRTMAKLWQQSGVITWVDVNVDPCFYDMNFIGVPNTHGFYATRYLANYPSKGLGYHSIEQDYARVEQHTTAPFIFLVYAGGDKVRDYCADRGWLWLPDKWSYKWEEVLAQHEKATQVRGSTLMSGTY